MFIATSNAIYAVEDDGQSEPVQVYKGTDHQDLGYGAMVSLSKGQAAVFALSDGTLLLLSEDDQKQIPTGIEDPIASLLLIRENPLTLLIGTDEGACMSIASLEKRGQQNESSRLTNWNVGKSGIHRGAVPLPYGRSLKPKTVFVTQISMSEASCVPTMKGFRGNPSRRNFIKMSIRSPRVLQTTIEFMRTHKTVFMSVPDRGNSWVNRIEGLPRRYGTGVAVHPADPDLLIATVQNGPRGGGAWLCRSENEGRTWTQLNDQLTASTDRISTGCIAFTSDGTAWAVIGKTLYIGKDRATDWQPFWTAPEYDGEYPIQTLAI